MFPALYSDVKIREFSVGGNILFSICQGIATWQARKNNRQAASLTAAVIFE